MKSLYKLRDKIIVDVGGTIMGKIPYSLFPDKSDFEFRAFTANDVCYVVLGLGEEKEDFFNSLTLLLRDNKHPQHRLIEHCFTCSNYYPLGFGRNFSLANENLLNKFRQFVVTEPDQYWDLIVNIEKNLFVEDETLRYGCDPKTVNLLQIPRYQDAYLKSKS